MYFYSMSGRVVSDTIGSLRSTTRPARRRAFKTKKFGLSTNNSIIIYYHANLQRTYKEICHARQKLPIIRGPRSIVNRVVILNTTLNKHYYVFHCFSQRESLMRPKRCYLKSKLQQTLHRFSRT